MEKKSRDEHTDAMLVGFLADFPNLAYARANLTKLGQHAVSLSAKEQTNHWYWTAITLVKAPKGMIGGWYGCHLPNLLRATGWFNTDETVNEFVKEIKTACKALKSDSQRKYSKDEVLQNFKKEFPSLEFALLNLDKLGQKEAANNAKGNPNTWYYSSRSLFTSSGRKRGDWYADMLPNLVRMAGWLTTDDEVDGFVSKIKNRQQEIKSRKLSEIKRTMTHSKVIAGFKQDFPTLDYIEKDVARLGYSNMRRSTKGFTRHWFQAAQSVYASSKWYDGVLPHLMFEAGLFNTVEEAGSFSKIIREKSLEAGRIRNAALHRKMTGKNNPNYSVAVRMFGDAKQSISFQGVEKFLTVNSVVAGRGDEKNSSVQIVISPFNGNRKELTAPELVRLKMNTVKWGGKLAEAYSNALPFIAPYLSTRLLLLHAFSLAQEGKIPELTKGASFMSGPGEVYEALQGMRPLLESKGIAIPRLLVDVDAEADMLSRSSNPNKLVAQLPQSGLDASSLDFVECSSLYQFHPKRHPAIVPETLSEAYRVLSNRGSLLLTSTGKQFGEKFEEGLKLMGFDIVTPANSKLELSQQALEDIRQNMGPEVLAKCLNAVGETYYLVAVKSNRLPMDVPQEWLSFEKISAKIPQDIKPAFSFSRSLGKDIKNSDELASHNAERLEKTIRGFSAEQHAKHAVLIQTLLSKYLLDEKPVKPAEEKIGANARLLRLKLNSLNLGGASGEDNYFLCLRRMAALHSQRLIEAKKSQKQQPAERISGSL